MNEGITRTTTRGGVGFNGLLFLVFLTLKLTHVIDWSWWWVTAPLWIPLSLVVVILLAILGFWAYYYYRHGVNIFMFA